MTGISEENVPNLHPTRHPIYENVRVSDFAKLLASPEPNLENLWELMYASHEGYSACGLGMDETDLLVGLVRSSPHLFGAKVTGAGSGGTVVVLCRKGEDAGNESGRR